jgi:hypothetical protein
MTILFSTLSPALDSALCCLALGAAVPAWGGRPGVAVLFGLCDLAASLFASLTPVHFVSMPPAALYAVFAMSIGVGARAYPRLAWAAPVVLSLDNLATAGSVPDAFVHGTGSALFALVALRAGAWLSRRASVPASLDRVAVHEWRPFSRP